MTESGTWREELSIEETNKIRASLGLKPLKLDEPKKDVKKSNNDSKSSTSDTNEITETIKKLKQKREANTVGKSIAEQLIEDNGEDDDTSAWLERSKAIQNRNLNMLKSSTTTNKRSTRKASSYTSDDLSGIKVGNELKNFDDGNEHILVLKDSNVLDDDDSELIDIRLTEKEKREKALDSSKKKSQYDQFDEYGKRADILSHYDEDNIKETGFIITNKSSTGIEDLAKKQDMQDEIRKRLDSYSAIDLSENTSSIQTSFYTNEEMLKFKKPTTKKKKKKLRSKKDDDDTTILQQLDATTSSDLGSRKSRESATDKEEESDRAKRESNYQKALDKASATAKLTYSSDVFEEAEDEDFYKSLSNAKKAPIIEKNISQKVSEMVQRRKKEQDEEMNTTDTNHDSLFISPVSEFVRGLKNEGLLSNFKPTIKQEEEEEEEEVREKELIKVKKEDTDMDVDDQSSQEEGERDDDDDDEQDNQNPLVSKFETNVSNNGKSPTILPEEPMVSTSMSAALKLLIQKGELKPQEKTKRKLQSFDDYEPIIQHKDEFGRIMNRKEAFVAHSQRFHGKKSGKNKQEKRLRKFQEELKQKHMSSTDTPLGMMKSLQTYQEKSNSAYLVLSGKSIKEEVANMQKSSELSVKKHKN